MKMNTKACVLVICLTLTTTVRAEDYEITWYTIDGGGGTSSGGPYTLVGTIGQADTGVAGGDEYVLSAGFWPGSFGCVVNLTDLMVLAEWWLESGAANAADLDGDKQVGMADFAEMALWWYGACPSDWPLK